MVVDAIISGRVYTNSRCFGRLLMLGGCPGNPSSEIAPGSARGFKRAGLKKRRGTARTPKPKRPATPENHGHVLECGSALPLLGPINSRQRNMFM